MGNKKFLTVLLHIIGCIVFLALPVFLTPDFPRSLNIYNSRPTQRDLIAYAIMISFFYLNFFVLIPKFYVTKKYFIFFGIVLLCFVIIASIPSLIMPEQGRDMRQPNFRYMPPPQQDSSMRPLPNNNTAGIPPPMHYNFQPRPFNSYLFGVLHYLFIFIALVFFSLILTINNRLKQSEREKLQAELRYLKAQINPHFLFNTLNTIYSLAVEQSAATAEAVVKLSAMMRYVLNDAGKDFVPLEKEIEYINNYIQLQQMRFDGSVTLHFNIRGIATGKMIAPLILIPFIENAFKYGINAEAVSVINISIYIEATRLHMLVENNKVRHTKNIEERTGLGINNTKNRLQLLYAGNYELLIKDDDVFHVSLILNLE